MTTPSTVQPTVLPDPQPEALNGEIRRIAVVGNLNREGVKEVCGEIIRASHFVTIRECDILVSQEKSSKKDS